MLPEVDEEVGDLARRRQESLQVARVVAGQAEAPRRDDGCAELQAQLQTGRVRQSTGTRVSRRLTLWDAVPRLNSGGLIGRLRLNLCHELVSMYVSVGGKSFLKP